MPHECMTAVTRRKADIQQPAIRRQDDRVRVEAGVTRRSDIGHVEPSAHGPAFRMLGQPAFDVVVAMARLKLPARRPITHVLRLSARERAKKVGQLGQYDQPRATTNITLD